MWGAEELEDEIRLWRQRGGSIEIPRGFAHRLQTLAGDVGEEIEWESTMTIYPPSEHYFRNWKPFELRETQVPARDEMLEWAQGIVMMPTGAGKTVTALEFARWAGQKTLVIVGKVALAEQWRTMLREHYGIEPGYIGEGKWDEAALTIATWQTLWRKDVHPTFWRGWGCVIFDEVHHCSANSLFELAGRFPAFYRLGLSATPKWDPLLFPFVEAVIGPIIFRGEGENLHTPEIKLINTNFEAEFVPTHYAEAKNGGRKRVQNNYTTIMASLVRDPGRNDLIYHVAREEAQSGHHVLVVTRQIEHVKQLVSRLEKVFKLGQDLHVLTGSQTGADAQRIARAIENADKGTVLVSTVADEALDMPRLDRLVMAFPLRKLPLVKQQVGRIVRSFEGKEDAIAYDVSDPSCGVLKSQRRDRTRLYYQQGWDVEYMDIVA